jgi:hypothetical protein
VAGRAGIVAGFERYLVFLWWINGMDSRDLSGTVGAGEEGAAGRERRTSGMSIVIVFVKFSIFG